MAKHVVLGAGPIGRRVAERLVTAGFDVTVVTRSGGGPDGATKVRADVSDGVRLSEITADANVIYNCLNPAYDKWPALWPPMAAAILHAAETSGAVLVVCSNLYGYGPVTGPMTEATPLKGNSKGQIRAQIWRDALAMHQDGRIRMTEARGSDYLGAGRNSVLGDSVIPRMLRGKSAQVFGAIDTAHTFTYVDDMAGTLVALGADGRAWGRAWHVPSDITCSVREGVASLAAAAGVPMPKLSRAPWPVLDVIGLFNPVFGEFKHVRYQWDHDFVMDSSAARDELGLTATAPEQVWTSVIAAYR